MTDPTGGMTVVIDHLRPFRRGDTDVITWDDAPPDIPRLAGIWSVGTLGMGRRQRGEASPDQAAQEQGTEKTCCEEAVVGHRVLPFCGVWWVAEAGWSLLPDTQSAVPSGHSPGKYP